MRARDPPSGAFRGLASRLCASALAAASLSACLADKFASRAIDYNLAAEQVQNREMLLNVLRASQRRPLEFTALQTITGTGSIDAGAELDIPLRQNSADEALMLVPQIAATARPAFTINVLDTQEFYQGILRPQTIQTFDFYLKRGLSRRLLFDLFFSGVTVDARTGRTAHADFEAGFANDVADDGRFDDYQLLVELLIQEGLTTDSVKPAPTPLGPPLTPEESVRADTGQKAAAGGLELKAVDWCALDGGEIHDLIARLGRPSETAERLKGGCADAGVLDAAGLPRVLYRLQKPGAATGFILCFQPSDDALGPQETTCEALKRRTGPAAAGQAPLHLNLAHAAPKLCEALNRNRLRGGPLDCTRDLSMEFTFTARSTYEIIRYLGEVVRRANYPDFGRVPRTIAVKAEKGGLAAAAGDAPGLAICDAGVAPGGAAADGMECQPLFEVRRSGRDGSAFIKVSYAGADYEVVTNGRSDRMPTLDALQVVTELLALNRSAKDLPATTVFTVVSP